MDREISKNDDDSNFSHRCKSKSSTKTVVDVNPSNVSSLDLWPFQLITCDNDEPRACDQSFNETRLYSTKEIVCLVLMELREIVEKQLGLRGVLIEAVISVLCLFDDSQRIAVIEAAKMAGINVLKVIDETSATALAYALDKSFLKKLQVHFRNNILLLNQQKIIR